MSIRLITFDLDNTLWQTDPVIQAAEIHLRGWLAEHAPHLPPFSKERLSHARAQVLAREPALKHRVSELRRQVLRHALLEAGYTPGEAAELAESGFQVFLEARHRIEPFAEVHPTLTILARHYRLAVISNGNADIRRLGLARYFQFALSADELGVGKPDPRPFREALRRADVPAAQAVHIGDHPDDDIRGAQRIGMRAIWFNPGAQPWPATDQPDGQIHNLAELPALLNQW